MKLHEARGLDQIAGQVMVRGAAGAGRAVVMGRAACAGRMIAVLGGRIVRLTGTEGKRTGHRAEGGTKKRDDGDGNCQARE